MTHLPPLPRRAVLAAALALSLLPATALAQPGGAGWRIDWQGAAPDPVVAARLARQVALVRALPIRPNIRAFFARQKIYVNRLPGQGSHTPGDGAGVYITRDFFPDDNPVLLHELIHRWHFDTLANTPRVAPLREIFAAERANPHWPPQAYMYRSISEFLAMNASVVLYGRAARPPFTRAQVARRTPRLYRWIADEFGLRL